MTMLDDMFASLRAEQRAALVGYLPAGKVECAVQMWPC